MNILRCYVWMLHKVMKLIGMQSKQVEIESGTVINFLLPSKTNPNKPNLVLLHGFAGDGLISWQFQIPSLTKKYNLYVPDFLFFGKSYTRRNERTTKFQADCIANGLKNLGIQGKCIIVGYSYGGFVGFQLAEYYPDLVGSMVIIGSALAWSETLNKRALERNGFSSLQQLLLPTDVQGVKNLLNVSAYSFPKTPDFLYNNFLEAAFDNRKERGELLDALVARDQDVTTHQFQQTIHLIWGSEDKLTNMEIATTLKERLGGKGMLKIVDKAGHLLFQERPLLFNKYLKQMLHSLAKQS